MDSDLRGHPLANSNSRIVVRIRAGGAGPDDRRRVGRTGLIIQRVEIARSGRSAEIIRGNERRKEYRSGKHDGARHRPLCRRAGRSHQLDVPPILALDQPDQRGASRGDISEGRIVRVRHLVRPRRTDNTDHRIRGVYQSFGTSSIVNYAVCGVCLSTAPIHHVVFNSEQILLLGIGLVGVTQIAARPEEDPDLIRIIDGHRWPGRHRPHLHRGSTPCIVVIEVVDHFRG